MVINGIPNGAVQVDRARTLWPPLQYLLTRPLVGRVFVKCVNLQVPRARHGLIRPDATDPSRTPDLVTLDANDVCAPSGPTARRV